MYVFEVDYFKAKKKCVFYNSLHYHYSLVHSDSVVESIRVPSGGQIELFDLLLEVIFISYLKLYTVVYELLVLNKNTW